MRLIEIKRGHAYHHETLGTVFIVGPHPHDGCAFIVMYHDTEADEEKYVLVIPEELVYEITTEIVFPQPGFYPLELTNEVRQVLSLAPHELHAMARTYRRAGHDITDTLGAEHAFVLDRMLRIALTHQRDYLTEMRKDLHEAMEKAK